MSPGTAIPGYAFAAPTEADGVAALVRVFGATRGPDEWSHACRDAFVCEGRVGPRDMPRVADVLAGRGGAVAAVGRSLQVRLRTHARLALRQAALQSLRGTA